MLLAEDAVGVKEGLFLGRASLRASLDGDLVAARKMDVEERSRGFGRPLEGRKK